MRKVWADHGFAGRLVDWAAQTLGRELEVVRKDPDQRDFIRWATIGIMVRRLTRSRPGPRPLSKATS
ncbi:hypothetical protein [Actinoallomurus sp. CA-142502]|uniref:hypothetical protein n=1 Tax=Actinoallomurus sp. CA-142502 TaxID=3239885 RepID=UPI003D8BDD45